MKLKDINYKESMNRIIRSHQMAMLELGVEDDTITKQALLNVSSGIARLELLERYLIKWQQQLNVDGVNSKSMVLNDIQFLINIKNLPDRKKGKE